MPQASRKDPATQRAQDKESKRARGALSCAECRRLKLKCDKMVPCSSCKRRGCSSICPNGVLITGQGTRFVLADTEKLHAKIELMSDRIRSLEDALTILHSTTGVQEPHPLLDRNLLKIKSSLELHAAIQSDNKVKEEELEDSQYLDAFGTLAIREHGASTFYGRSAGSEVMNGHSSNGLPTIREWQQQAAQARGLPPILSSLSQPFPLPASQPIPDLDYLIDNFLPPWQEASCLCDLYLEQAPWFFGAVTRRQLSEEILPMWYAEAPRSSVVPSLDSGLGVGTISSSPNAPADFSNGSRTGSAHDLALLFMVFCFGALTDVNLPAAPDNILSERYYDLTKVGLNLEGLLDRPPSVSTVQALSLMGIYEGMRNGENSIESTWALMGMATKLAQSVNRDSARWKLSPAEVQKRRSLFWELFITDCWQSLATGRLATFSLPFVDCELPYDPDGTISDDGTVQPSFPFWKARFGAECVSAVVQGTLTSRAPKYSIILDLDRKVRDMELPKYAQGPIPEGAGLKETMSYCMPTNYRELTLLYIHRCFFTHAIQSNPSDPIKSQYAPSFLAGYRSACDLLNAIRKQFGMFPAQIARFWVLWTHAFSSAVMISSVVTHGSRSKVAPAALLELKSACELFEQAASHGGRAVKFLPILQRLLDKAQKIFYDTCNGVPPAVPNDIFRPSDTGSDEISVFSGKTHTVTTKAARTPNTRSPGSNGSARSSQSPGGSPSQTFSTTNPSFDGVHPTLVQELHTFDGHIHAQLHNAYTNHHAKFSESHPNLHRVNDYNEYNQASLVPTPNHYHNALSSGLQHQHQQPPRLVTHQQLQHRHSTTRSHNQSHRQHHSVQPITHQPQHEMYTIPADYIHQNQITSPISSEVSISPTSSTPVRPYHLSETVFETHPPQSRPHAGVARGSGYWPNEHHLAVTDVVTYNDHPVRHGTQTRHYNHGHQGPVPVPVPSTHPQYTPEAAMQGMAAPDPQLQETWRSYMYKVSLGLLIC
ncbi:hypothetical protein J3R30DRAFT_3278237 [Lentinula aciculospora]|uniref:Zn(2)-C6 fungal-type domain-containing protein n=1 Tax=Lentinula aciculospora TaxID=153920 RepID=A0A9W9DXW7_9AGAR|nr:hypothetical protein J3R30DRAFT_3278237 [Lentinula aciculospora]